MSDLAELTKQLEKTTLSQPNLTNVESQDLVTLIQEIFEKGSSIQNKALAREILLKCCQSEVPKGVLYNKLKSDPDKFIEILQAVEDYMGHIFFSTKEDKDLESIERAFTIIKANLKKQDVISVNNAEEYNKLRFNISFFLSIITNTKTPKTQYLSMIVPFLSIKFAQEEAASLITLIIIKQIELDKPGTESELSSYSELLLENGESITISEFTNLLKLLDILFPVLPEIALESFMSGEFKSILLEMQGKGRLDANSAIKVLLCFSSACINDDCRTFISENYLAFLNLGMNFAKNKDVRILSSLVLVKIWNFIKLKGDKDDIIQFTLLDLCDTFTKTFDGDDEKLISFGVEGLAYLSLKAEVQKALRQDESFVEKLLSLLKKLTESSANTPKEKVKDSSLVYGISIIFSQITKIQEIKSEKDKTLNFLKSYTKPASKSSDIKESNEEVFLFNEALLDIHEIVGIISKNFKNFNRPIQNQFIILLHSFSSKSLIRNEIIKQGGLNMVLDYLIAWSDLNGKGISIRSKQDTEEDSTFGMYALRTLAKLLIASDPKLVFNKYSAITSIPFLIELLGPDISTYGENNSAVPNYQFEFNSLDIFESLLALTNVSSLEDINVKNIIITKGFDFFDNFLIDSNESIQTASLELISNLITSPTCSEKFFNLEKKENAKRLDLLIKLIELENVNAQCAVLGIFANASEYEMISRLLVENKQLLERLTALFEEQYNDNEVIIRASYLLLNMVSSVYDNEEILKELRANTQLKQSFTKVLKNNKNKEILTGIWDICKIIKYI